ncbi:hypothetical protein [Chryseobacterium indoltheticum]|nr:hypothetical protein [Chryseobacterium indoltheticum]
MSASGSSEAFSIDVSGVDIYLAGYYQSNSSSGRATYWKSWIPVYLTNGVEDAVVRKILVVNKKE